MKILNCGILFFMLKTAVLCEKSFNSSVVSYSLGYKIYNSSTRCTRDVACIRKCCEVDYVMRGKRCVLRNDSDWHIPVYRETDVTTQEHIEYIVGMINCDNGFYKLEPDVYDDDVHYLQTNGSLWKPVTGEMLAFEKFCIEDLGDNATSAFVCFEEDDLAVKISRKMNAVGMIISMPFLLLTFLVYAVLPDRNLHGKCLMCYVITLFGAYAFLVFIQLYPNDLAGANCKTLGILCFFFFTVSFFWMNVMSIDIWWAFSGLRGFSGSRKEAERKRFILYCGYAWGVSLLLTMIVIGLTVSENIEKNVWYNPGMGDGQCWFRDGVPTLLYFYVPMATIIVVNITLFAVTACKIKRVQQDTAMLRKDESKKHSYENDKQRFNLYLKLMLAMGVNWAMEIVSWIVDWQIGRVPPPVWYLTDFCNALYGVFVFFIFVFKRNIWKLLKRRYYMIMGKPHLARSMTQTAYSPRTTGSSLNHTVSTDKNFVTDSSVLTSEVS